MACEVAIFQLLLLFKCCTVRHQKFKEKDTGVLFMDKLMKGLREKKGAS